MKNTINYYYNMRINKLIKDHKNYYFNINDIEYRLINYNDPINNINSLYNLNNEMIKRNCLINQIVLNKDNQVITFINNEAYILLRINCNNKRKINFNDINYIQYKTYNINSDKTLYTDNWIKLWCKKIDYYEYQINQLGKDYPLLCDSLSYYIGLGENAISYLVNNIKNHENKFLVVSHKRIKLEDGDFEFYNPLNFIIDMRVRDVAEYIKDSFFNDKFDFLELKNYLNYSKFTKDEYIYLFSRLLFPTYYFDKYDDIINKKTNENNISYIIEKNSQYEDLLYKIYNYIIYEKKVQIEPIEWLIKDHS